MTSDEYWKCLKDFFIVVWFIFFAVFVMFYLVMIESRVDEMRDSFMEVELRMRFSADQIEKQRVAIEKIHALHLVRESFFNHGHDKP